MSGTSMATLVATGVLARLIAQAGLHTMPPTATRSKAIVALARAHAVKLGLPRATQGHGLLR
jgi:minor extracellular protease Epr